MEEVSELKRKAEELLSKALEYESSGHLEIASQSYIKYSRILKQLNETDEAKSYLEIADALYPLPLDVRGYLADIYFETGDAEKAVIEYCHILNLYVEQGLISSAIDLCKNYIEKIPSSTKLKYELADIYLQSDRTQKAINTYLEIINLGVNSAPALENLGDIYTRRNSVKEAISSFINAAGIYSDQENWEDALHLLKKILRLNPDSLAIRRQLIKVLFKLGKKEELVSELLVLARDLKNKGKEEMALATYSKILHFDPSNEMALENLGAPLRIKDSGSGIEKIFTGEMSSEVSESLQSILTELSDKETDSTKDIDSRTHFDMGIAYLEMDLYEKAIHQFQLASKDPKLKVSACNLLGMLFLELGDIDLSIKEFQRGLKFYGDEDEYLGLRYNLSMAYKKKGDYFKAIEQLEEIYIIDIEYLDVKEQLDDLKLKLDPMKSKPDEERNDKGDSK